MLSRSFMKTQMLGSLFVSALAVCVSASSAHAQIPTSSQAAEPQRVSFLLAAGYLGSPGANGAFVSTGLRIGLGRHAAFGFDFGYGLMDASPVIHDRWWLMPSMAAVFPIGPVRLDVGFGFGLGTASGFADWDTFIRGPATHGWAFQVVPAIRGHLMGSTTLSRDLDAFVRLELASLLLDGNSFGFRDGNPNPTVTDTTWLSLSVGFAFGAM